MSFVEQALKKLQTRANRDSTARPAPVVGSLVSAIDATGVASPQQSHRLIHIDRNELRRAGMLPPEQQERRLAGEYRRIKRPLLAAALGKGQEPLPSGRLIMLASALPGEGKTFTSMNLALSMALEKDVEVVLVDADVAKPHISRTFGVEREPGLVDALLDGALDIESLVIPTDIDGLRILPAGKIVENATELLASRRMEEVIARLSSISGNRILLFDSPPLLLTNESRVLASLVGQVVIVVRAAHTAQSTLNEALATFTENKPISLVLNQSEETATGAYYGYGEYGASSADAS